MIAMQVARIIAGFVVFLETSGDDIVDPDAAVQIMEGLAGDVEALEKAFLRELVDAFAVVAMDYSDEAQNLVKNIPRYFYLEEALAFDDPVRLAELDALRDAAD